MPANLPKQIDWDCQFGKITQTGKSVIVVGETWNATGAIHGGGTIILFWTGSSDRVIIGVYRRDGDDLTGHYGWADEVVVTEDGDLCSRDGGPCRARHW